MQRHLASACVIAFGAAVFAAPASAVTNLLANGDFETVDDRLGLTVGDSGGQRLDSLAGSSGAASWDVYASLPGGWTAGGEGIEVQTNLTINGAGPINSLPAFGGGEGFHYVELDSEQDDGTSNSSMSQTVTGLTAGRYVFSFFYSPRTDGVAVDDNLISWLISPPGVSGSISGPSLATGTTVGEWTEMRTVFDLLADGDVTVTLSAGGLDNELGGFIDNVSLSVIPLPAGAMLILGAFGGAAAFRRFSRA